MFLRLDRYKKTNSNGCLMVALSVILIITVTPLHAYLDPGAGSFLLQIFLGGLAGLALLLKSYWRKITAFFGAKNNRIDAKDGSEGESSRS